MGAGGTASRPILPHWHVPGGPVGRDADLAGKGSRRSQQEAVPRDHPAPHYTLEPAEGRDEEVLESRRVGAPPLLQAVQPGRVRASALPHPRYGRAELGERRRRRAEYWLPRYLSGRGRVNMHTLLLRCGHRAHVLRILYRRALPFSQEAPYSASCGFGCILSSLV